MSVIADLTLGEAVNRARDPPQRALPLSFCGLREPLSALARGLRQSPLTPALALPRNNSTKLSKTPVQMGFRLIPIGGAGIHEGLQLRGTHKVAVSGNLCVLLNSCEEARAHAEVAADGVAWIPYWVALLLHVLKSDRSWVSGCSMSGCMRLRARILTTFMCLCAR